MIVQVFPRIAEVLPIMVKLEKIEYKPIPVRDLLVEIKDLSELMIDLAYSSALFDSKELAEEVLELEQSVDTLAYLIDMNVMIAARDAKDAELLVGVSTVAAAADKISDAAADIATLVIKNIGLHPLVRQAFEQVEEHLVRVEIKPDSILAGVPLGGLELAARIGVDIIAIRRNKKWVINPQETETLKKGDILIARGAPHGVDELKDVAQGTLRMLGG
jgi:uncharacterized protein with PhoU and TrkA domain